MTESQQGTARQEPAEQDAPLGLQPLPGILNLLEDGSAGYCSNGVCHVPAPKTR